MKTLLLGQTQLLMVGLALLFVGGIYLSGPAPTTAQGETPALRLEIDDTERPFQMPFAEPPGPNTWLMAQPYGNTTGAYRQRFTTYGASGGIHFGVDLSAPCGTEVVAIADGVVFAVDGPFGSPPHNLMIDHPDLGYASMYGHLLEAPDLQPGDGVRQGQVVALSGDSQETCAGRPHLHLEIRDLNYHTIKYNPAELIETNWDSLTLISNQPRDFARDLTDPRKWQSLYDQPEARTGGKIVNDFAYPWPPDWENGSTLPPATGQGNGVTETATTLPPLKSLPAAQQLTRDDCCTQAEWDEASSKVRFIDQPAPTDALGVWAVEVGQPELGPQLTDERLGRYSPDGRLVAYPDPRNGLVVIEHLSDGQQWTIDTEGESISFAPNSQQIIWTTTDDDAPRDRRLETTWMADVDGSNARIVHQDRRTNRVAWLSDDEWLMSRRIPGSSDQQLFVLSLSDGSQRQLIDRMPRFRGSTLSPDKQHLVYYVTFEPQVDENGVWLLDLEQWPLRPQKLPFFGTYRWRDSQNLIYIPFDPTATEHSFHEYNLVNQETRPLFPAGTDLMIANNEWQVSPDGTKIIVLAANGSNLDGLWLLNIIGSEQLP
jgi:murein DD-endopeptidase MepM/ murein hydrolase activator NlpD